ncbi:MAG: hypothetical protein HY986_02495 [Candidatus Melainabacteria bacterium]|nr:hypothetical protein [Candidatus Melainabacteria bacterium]
MTYEQILAAQTCLLQSLASSGRSYLLAAKSIGFTPDGKLCINAYARSADSLNLLPDTFDGVTITKHLLSSVQM